MDPVPAKSRPILKRREYPLFLGPTGLGKSYLALAIDVLAAREGYRVFCASTKRHIQNIHVVRMKNNPEVLFKRMLSSRL